MSEFNFKNLQILVADDFSNFRRTVTDMLSKMGASRIEVAEKGSVVLDYCEHRQFDIILCDYDLGSGKNGQQVLEALRFNKLISRKTLFVMVSADSSKDVVMASYDCEPDDYLMKPITARMLHQRLQRLLTQRQALMPVYRELDVGNREGAIELLSEMARDEGRHVATAQKLLGELLIEVGDLGRAEKLFTKALEVRPLDWARLGLARVKHLRGELNVAQKWLQNILKDNPLFLPAYDALATNWYEQKDRAAVQATVQRSVQISPRSILRQKRLAEVAELNGDLRVALTAMRAAIKLGELSCHGRAEDTLDFVRLANATIQLQLEDPQPLGHEVVDLLNKARQRYTLDRQQAQRADILEGHTHLLTGNTARGRELLTAALEQEPSGTLEVQIERLLALRALGETAKAQQLQKQLIAENAHNEAALERLDLVLDEPASEINRNFVSAINREGINLYNRAQFDDALICFDRAARIFPNHIGLQLNIIQALIGRLGADGTDIDARKLVREKLASVVRQIAPEHAHYQRYLRLKTMADAGARG